MKILVISHNVFSYNENMGKTLTGLFSGFQANDICQLYFHSEIPTVENICSSYYRITDKDAIKSILFRWVHGKTFNQSQLSNSHISSRTDKGTLAKVYQAGRKRTPIIYLARDAWWLLSNWFNKDLKDWLNFNRPDLIFFAAGDYSFSYKIAYKIANYLQIPLVVYCVDDFYLFNSNKNRFLGSFRQTVFMKEVHKTVGIAKRIVTICEKMANDYAKLFGKECNVIYTTAKYKILAFSEKRYKFSYFGSLGVNRDLQLIDIGKAVANTSEYTGIKSVDVYTSEQRPEVLERMKKAPGITLHKAVTTDEMDKILSNCIGVIHTESFDDVFRNRVKYSVSTKIAESLMYGPCIFAYGPEEVASIEYLMQNHSGYVVTKKDNLEFAVSDFLQNAKLRKKIENHAREIAKRNHSSDKNYELLKEWLEATAKLKRNSNNGKKS